MNDYGLKDDLVGFIVDKAMRYGMSSVVLFGSRARGDFSDKSDIDLAVFGAFFDEYVAELEENCPTLLAFDFVNAARDIGAEPRDRIDEEGVVLYEVRQL